MFSQNQFSQIIRYVREMISSALLQYQKGGGGGNPSGGSGFYMFLGNGTPTRVYPDGIPYAGANYYGSRSDHQHEFGGVGFYDDGVPKGDYRRVNFKAGEGAELLLEDNPTLGAVDVTFGAPDASTIWQPLTNGDAASPELIFADGDVIMVGTT